MNKLVCLLALGALGAMPLAQGCPFQYTGCMKVVVTGLGGEILADVSASPGSTVGLRAEVVVYAGGGHHRYQWLQVDGSGAAIESPDQPVTNITLPQQRGTYRFLAIVTDLAGFRAASEVLPIVVG